MGFLNGHLTTGGLGGLTWVSGQAYNQNDIVQHLGILYRVKLAHTSATAPASDTTNYEIANLSSSTLFLDATNSKVGIGTNTPATSLNIHRPSGSGISTTLLLSTAAGSPGDGSSIEWNGAVTSEKVAAIQGVMEGTDLGSLRFLRGNGANSYNESMRIDASGSLVVGNSTATTGCKVELRGSGTANVGILHLVGSASPGQGNKWLTMRDWTNTVQFFYIDDYSNMYISGNIGVNETTPNVAGWSKALTITGAAGNHAGLELASDRTTNGTIGGLDFIAKANSSTPNKEVVQIRADQTGSTVGNKGADLVFLIKGDGVSISEKMRIDSFGRVGIGAPCPTGDLFRVTGSIGNVSVDETGTNLKLNRNSNNYILAQGGTSANIHVISGASGGVILGNTATSWAALSDERTKTIIEPIINGVEKISNIRCVIGRYNNDLPEKRRSFLIAQDIQSVLPEAVTIGEDENQTLSLSYTDVIPLMIAAIKELVQKNQELQTRIEVLETK